MVVALVVTLVSVNVVLAGGWAALVDRPAPARTAGTPFGRLVAPLTACWLAVALLPVHNFIKRSNAEAVSQAGLEPLLEIAYFGAVGITAVVIVLHLEPSLDNARPPMVVYALPVWAAASAVWSDTSAYAFARGAEMVVVATLAWATLALGRASSAACEDLVETILRSFVRIVLVLVGLGVIFGPVLVPASAENLERFSWIGAHPNGSGLLLAAAIVVATATAPAVLGLTPAGRVGVIGALAVAMVANQSRTGLVALLGGLVAVIVLRGHVRRLWHRRWTPVAVAGGAVVLVAARSVVSDYVLRGRDADSLLSGNGRLGLWPIGFDALDGVFDWVCGLGYGAARTVFVAEEAWATTAHNSVLSVLVSLGLVGVVLLGAVIVTTMRDLHRSGSSNHTRYDVGLVGFIVVLLLGALASDAMAEPNVGLAGLFLAAAVARARCSGVTELSGRRPAGIGVGD